MPNAPPIRNHWVAIVAGDRAMREEAWSRRRRYRQHRPYAGTETEESAALPYVHRSLLTCTLTVTSRVRKRRAARPLPRRRVCRRAFVPTRSTRSRHDSGNASTARRKGRTAHAPQPRRRPARGDVPQRRWRGARVPAQYALLQRLDNFTGFHRSPRPCAPADLQQPAGAQYAEHRRGRAVGEPVQFVPVGALPARELLHREDRLPMCRCCKRMGRS